MSKLGRFIERASPEQVHPVLILLCRCLVLLSTFAFLSYLLGEFVLGLAENAPVGYGVIELLYEPISDVPQWVLAGWAILMAYLYGTLRETKRFAVGGAEGLRLLYSLIIMQILYCLPFLVVLAVLAGYGLVLCIGIMFVVGLLRGARKFM